MTKVNKGKKPTVKFDFLEPGENVTFHRQNYEIKDVATVTKEGLLKINKGKGIKLQKDKKYYYPRDLLNLIIKQKSISIPTQEKNKDVTEYFKNSKGEEISNLWNEEKEKREKLSFKNKNGKRSSSAKRDDQSDFPHNLIYFGAPGTGKSFTLKGDKKVLFGQDRTMNDEDFAKKIKPEQVVQVTFYPDYSYADFVGCYKPISEKIGKYKNGKDQYAIRYVYVPGPFLQVLKNALKDKENKYLLIIEEINRTNVAAVFGDAFQLLDRDKDGSSEYFITPNDEVKEALESQDNQLCIPPNMYIWATMNSADQGVFPMDTAFKRRWSFKYLGIDDSEGKIKETVIKVKLENGKIQEIKWNELRHAINNRLSDAGINEDKLMGPFFLKEEFLKDDKFVDAFKNKVLMYLFEDAAKHKVNDVFQGNPKRFSVILKEFDKNGFNIFNFNGDDRKKLGLDKEDIMQVEEQKTESQTEVSGNKI